MEDLDLEGSLVWQLILTEMWCDGRMDKDTLLCTVVHLHLTEFTAFLDILAPSYFVI